MENKELLLALFTFLGGFVGGMIALIGQIIISNKNKLSEKFGDKVYVDYVADDLACTSNGSSYTTFEQ